MFVRGLAGALCGLIPLYLDELWILWDKDAQTLHDKLVNTVVVKAKGSEKIVELGSLGPPPEGFAPPPAYAPPVTFPVASPPPAAPSSQPGGRFCSNCGQAIATGAQFCASCGARVAG
jgi:hypothetical protein